MITAADGPLLVVFAAVVHHGSFSAAATSLKLSKSVISERVKQLEERCGARLLERTTRRLRLTEVGASVLDAATRVQDALGQLSHRLDASRTEPSGLLRIATTNDLGPLLIGPVVARLLAAHPKVRVEIVTDDARRDLLDSQVDVAIRLGEPKASSYVVRKLAVMEEPIVAAPALAGALGAIGRPRELAGAPWVRHSLLSSGAMRFVGPGGARDEFVPSVRAESNSGPTLLSLLLHGAGVGTLPEHLLQEQLHQGRLVRLCPAWVWKTLSLFALMPSKSAPRPNIKAFLAMLQEQIALDRARWRPVRSPVG